MQLEAISCNFKQSEEIYGILRQFWSSFRQFWTNFKSNLRQFGQILRRIGGQLKGKLKPFQKQIWTNFLQFLPLLRNKNKSTNLKFPLYFGTFWAQCDVIWCHVIVIKSCDILVNKNSRPVFGVSFRFEFLVESPRRCPETRRARNFSLVFFCFAAVTWPKSCTKKNIHFWLQFKKLGSKEVKAWIKFQIRPFVVWKFWFLGGHFLVILKHFKGVFFYSNLKQLKINLRQF